MELLKGMIYLDHNATTPVDQEAAHAMRPFMAEEFGNPSSSYPLGRRAESAVDQARREVAALLGCGTDEVVFTSGGSESNNIVLKGLVDVHRPEQFHIITSAVEHPAVLTPCRYLMDWGVQVTILPVDGAGRVDPSEVEKAISPATGLITIMLANNETGVLQPVKEIAAIARDRGIAVHTDAAQAVGKIDVNVHDLDVDFLTVAGHKLYGPKGIGALYIRNGREVTPLVHGAGQEGGRRAGTESVILSVGLGTACRVAAERLEADNPAMVRMRDRLETRLFEGIDGLIRNGPLQERLPNTLNIAVPGIEGAEILAGLPKIMASTGAACHDRSVNLSHVLSAMSVPPEIGMGALRLTVGRTNTMDQIEEAAEMIIGRVRRIRNGASGTS